MEGGGGLVPVGRNWADCGSDDRGKGVESMIATDLIAMGFIAFVGLLLGYIMGDSAHLDIQARLRRIEALLKEK